MNKMEQDIIRLLQRSPGLSDRELTNVIVGRGEPPQNVNRTCGSLESQGIISRVKEDGVIRNYLKNKNSFPTEPQAAASKTKSFSVKCAYSKGTGLDPHPGFTDKYCPKCNGTGVRNLPGSREDYETDELCGGTGIDPYCIQDPWKPHDICDGTGLVRKVR